MDKKATANVCGLCPRCGYYFDRATAVVDGQRSPRTGDISICLSCGATLCFAQDAPATLATSEDVAALHPRQRELLANARRFIQDRGPIKRTLPRA